MPRSAMVLARSLFLSGAVAVSLSGCTSLGPDFVKPESPVLMDWSSDNSAISRNAAELSDWWRVFNDPVLNRLVETAYQQNLSLQITGLHILVARARLGSAVGNRYPQV